MIIWCGGFGTCGRWTQIYNFHSHGLMGKLGGGGKVFVDIL